MDLILKHLAIVTMDPKRRVIRDGAITIRGDRIYGVHEPAESPATSGVEVIDCSGMVGIPGLVNAHTHTYQSLLKGVGEGKKLIDWLKSVIYPLRGVMSPHDVREAALLSCVESIRSGSTCIIDNLNMNTTAEAVDAACGSFERAGLRAILARGITSKTKRSEKWDMSEKILATSLDEEIKLTREAIRRWKSRSHGRVSVCPAPVTIFSAGPDAFVEAKKLVESEGTYIHTHIAEVPDEVKSTLEDYGKTEVNLLYDLDVLGPWLQMAHGIWLDDEEIALLAKTKATVVHCPVSNMYLGSGIAKVPEMLKAGVNVALGSDGGTCGSAHDMLGVMRAAALLHKVNKLDPTAVTCSRVLEMATLGGARAIGKENELGSIEAGKKADLVLLDLKLPWTVPANDLLTTIVLYASPQNIKTVIVNGEIIMRNGVIQTLDEPSIIEEASAASSNLLKSSGVKV